MIILIRLEKYQQNYTTLVWNQTCESEIFTDPLDYLGDVIRSGRFRVSTWRTDAIQGLNVPDYSDDTQVISGLCNIFRFFVPNFAIIALSWKGSFVNGQLDSFDGLTYNKAPALESLKAELV